MPSLTCRNSPAFGHRPRGLHRYGVLLRGEPTSSWLAAKALSLRGFDKDLRQAIA